MPRASYTKFEAGCSIGGYGGTTLRDHLNVPLNTGSIRASCAELIITIIWKEIDMNIGIIGAGNIGTTLARKLTAAGHAVKLAGSKGPDDIREKAMKVGALPVAAHEAARDVEAIVLSIPFAKIPDVVNIFADVPADVVVIDTSNYYPMRDGNIAEVDDGKPESVWSSEQLGRPVVKTFNAVLAQTLAEGGGTAERIAIPVAGDDAHAKAIARELVNETGFDALDAGDLASSWRQQPGTPAYCTELTLPDLQHALSTAEKARAPGARDALIKGFMEATTPLRHEQIVARNREVTALR